MTKTEIEAADIVLVEDDTIDAEFVLRSLSQVVPENKVLIIRDGADCLEFLFGVGKFAGRNIHLLPKVIFLDIKLPKVNGIEVLQTMKDDPQTRVIPVVIFTSSREEQDVEMCYSLGASSYIVKPADRKEYAEVLMKLAYYWLKLNEHPR
jgi:CheY-like chemotaxis protein